jgi:hypothetical protein
MTNKIPRSVDFDKIDWHRLMFKAASAERDKLYHVTRVVIDPARERPEGYRQGWAEFRPRVEFFEYASYDRGLTGLQHSCYHGSERRLLEYTGWAARALMHMPGAFCPMWDYHRNPAFDRDAWTWGLYRVALNISGDLPFDLQGNGNYARLSPQDCPWLRAVVADTVENKDRGLQHVLAWQSEAAQQGGAMPRYVYGSLALDVFACSTIALDYFLKNAEELFFPARNLVAFGPRYYRALAADVHAKASRIWKAIQVDKARSAVKVHDTSYQVSAEVAAFFAVLRDAGGEWVTGPMIRELLGGGYEKFRPDKLMAGLRPELYVLVEARRPYGYRIRDTGA